MSADARPLAWDDPQRAAAVQERPDLRPLPGGADERERSEPTVRHDPARLLVVQQLLNGAATMTELFGRASDLARTECGFERGIVLAVEAGALRADRVRALEHTASDRLRRTLLVDPVELRHGSAEAEFIRLAEGGRSELSAGPSQLRSKHGMDEVVLGAIMPEDTVLAVLVLERRAPKLRPSDRVVVQGFAQMVTHALERQMMRQRITDLAAELKYMITSSSALLQESLHAPMRLDTGEAEGTTFSQMGSMKPQSTEELRELFTKREWTVAKEIIAGKSNREIASTLQLSPETVKTYVSRVLRKLGAANRAEAVARFFSLTAAAH